MKKLILISLFLTTSALAGPFTGDAPTTCQILKDGKVIKKASCTYGGYMNEKDMSLSYGFDVKGYPKKIDTAMVADGNDKFHFELNDKPAVSLLRDSKTLKVTKAPKDKMYGDNDLSCIQQKQTKFEFCVLAKDAFLTGQ